MRLVCIALMSALAAGCGRAPGPSAEPLAVSATLEPAQVHVGDVAALTVIVEHDAAAEVRLPGLDREDKSLVVRQTRTEAEALPGNRRRSTYRMDVTSFRVGSQVVSTNLVEARTAEGEVLQKPFPPLTLEVVSLVTAESSLQDLKPLAAWPRSPWVWVVPLLLAAACVAGLAYAWFRRRRAAPALPAAPRISPDRRALDRLDALAAKGYLESGRHEPYFVELSDIVRHYVEDRFGLHAPEQTTEEFLRAAAKSRLLSDPHQQVTREFLEQSDLVKFARWAPGRDVMERAMEAARRLVLETRLAPAQEAA